MSDRAVFFDPSRRRWWWIKGIAALVALIAAVLIGFWAVSLFIVTPMLPGMPGITTALQHTLRPSAHFPRHQTRVQLFLARRAREKLLAQIAHDRAKKKPPPPPVKGSTGIVAAFYAPWQETGLHSLQANASRMTHVLPAWVHLQENAAGLDLHDWDPVQTPHNLEVLEIARTNNVNVVPVFSNAQQGEFDPQRVHRFLNEIPLQLRLINDLRHWCLTNHFQGINVDFENLQPEDYAQLIPFLRRLKQSFAPANLQISVDLEAHRPENWKAAADLCNFVVVMAYDEHSSTGAAGPIASIPWYRDVIQRAVKTIPRDKLVVGLANYAYDWTEGENWADPITYQQALLRGQEFRVGEKPETIVDFDPAALNPTLWYVDDEGKEHEIWFLDAVTAANQWLIAQNYGARNVAIWVLGST
ncbi:MAG TPA: glycosyl hydrolase family 18 protein, partial [Thermoanaerobaculia bacterium]|nr:glycosyl hydrolase family 18 protein [Thermoanaerobaculia bacterium]